MPSPVDEALEWPGRAEQAREVARQLIDPGPIKQCDSSPKLPAAGAGCRQSGCAPQTVVRQRQEGNSLI
jgi:hypothetical protein